MLSLCFTLVTLQFARFIFHTKRRENCCYIGFPTEIENMLCSGLFIFNSFSSVLVASSKTPLHPSKLLKEVISILRVRPIPSTHEPARKMSEETPVPLTSLWWITLVTNFSHWYLACLLFLLYFGGTYSFCLLHCFSHVQWLKCPRHHCVTVDTLRC